jgi:phenylacetate-coenzyme A ligase PaaK-like adenylate-forming protein
VHGQPQTGRILVTVLNHPWLSLVRFEPGDLVRLADQPCPCGRRDGLTVAAIAGRTRDLTFTTTGQAVTVDQLDAAVGTVENLLAYQIEQ